MTGTLGLRLGDTETVQWTSARVGRPVPVCEDSPAFVVGNWRTDSGQLALPDNTRLSGRLYFGEKRVYGRFTKAHTPAGETYTVCMELFDLDEVGLKIEPESEPGKPLVVTNTDVRVVDHFR